jgi:hypothetical protein
MSPSDSTVLICTEEARLAAERERQPAALFANAAAGKRGPLYTADSVLPTDDFRAPHHRA